MAGASRVPHPALRPLCSAYVGYDHLLDSAAVHFGLPSPAATVVIAFDEPLDTGWVGEDGSREARWTTVSGLGVRPALIRTHGRQHGIQVDLTPAGVRALLGVPVAALHETLTTLPELGVPPDLQERLAALPDWERRFELLEATLLQRWHGHHRDTRADTRAEAGRAWALLRRTHGRLPVARLADEVGWSRRQLQTRFSGEYGVTPKAAARLFRFGHARRLAGAGVPLARVAVEAGYADQAHLTRDWRDLAGRAPAATLREMFPILQDAGA